VLTPFGHRQALIGPQSNRSLDNEYVYFGILWGVVPLAVMLLFPLTAVAVALRVRRDRLGTALAVLVVCIFVALTGVVLLTQQQMFVWLVVGGASAAAAARTRRCATG
jgi:uncharacterized membrane protein (DUF441 family)